jgi:hypothetical protein
MKNVMINHFKWVISKNFIDPSSIYMVQTKSSKLFIDTIVIVKLICVLLKDSIVIN